MLIDFKEGNSFIMFAKGNNSRKDTTYELQIKQVTYDIISQCRTTYSKLTLNSETWQ